MLVFISSIGRSNTSTRFLDGPLVSKLVAVIRKEDNFKVRVSALSVLRCNLEVSNNQGIPRVAKSVEI